MTCLQTVFKKVESKFSLQDVNPEMCVGVNLIGNGERLWTELWGSEVSQDRVIDSFDNTDNFVHNDRFASGPAVVLIAVGPIQGTTPRAGFKNPQSLEKALDFVDALQQLVVMQPVRIKGFIFVTDNASNPVFEFVFGSMASLRLQAPTLDFVSTLRLLAKVPDTSALQFFDAQLVRQVLNAAAEGEVLMHLSKGKRFVPKETPLKWNTPWVKPECLYVVSGATSSVAATLLPFLAGIGIHRFLLLTNRSKPSSTLLKQMTRQGAEVVHSEPCAISDELSIQTAVQKGIVAGARALQESFILLASMLQKHRFQSQGIK